MILTVAPTIEIPGVGAFELPTTLFGVFVLLIVALLALVFTLIRDNRADQVATRTDQIKLATILDNHLSTIGMNLGKLQEGQELIVKRLLDSGLRKPDNEKSRDSDKS